MVNKICNFIIFRVENDLKLKLKLHENKSNDGHKICLTNQQSQCIL